MPDETAVPARAGLPTPTALPRPNPNAWRRWVWPVLLALILAILLSRCERFRPECGHDPEYDTIAGQYTPVPEYHDCQFLVKESDGALVYGKTTALYLSE